MSIKALYCAILEEVDKEDEKCASRAISKAFRKNSLKSGNCFVDFNSAAHRTAYIRRFATNHAKWVGRQFYKLVQKQPINKILHQKSDLKICCLGGGPGVDVVGVFKALSRFPELHGRVSEISILDICSGWEGTFLKIIDAVKGGRLNCVPTTFLNSCTFKPRFIQVDLLGCLSEEAKDVISNADVICMVKCLSTILANDKCRMSLKVLKNMFKSESVFLLIDNCGVQFSDPVMDINNETNFIELLQSETKACNLGWVKSPKFDPNDVRNVL